MLLNIGQSDMPSSLELKELNDLRQKVAGLHFSQECLSYGEREILRLAESILKWIDTTHPCDARPLYDATMHDLRCTCGHAYHRHFDGYDDNAPVGCKYCNCDVFIDNKE